MNSTQRESSAFACRVALLTPLGRGAVATIAVCGPGATDCVGQYFQPAGLIALPAAPPDRILFGRWCSPHDRQSEELVVRRVSCERVEVHCHGGRWAAERILNALQTAGCQPVCWDELPPDPASDAIALDARTALARAGTLSAANILLDQCLGALRSTVESIRSQVASARPEVESDLRRLIERARLGRHLIVPWRVALIGVPNVGKSTLLNVLLGYQRAIVDPTPVTTRDVLRESTVFQGWSFSLDDTAGIRAVTDAVESAGVARTRLEIESADLVLWVRVRGLPQADLSLELPARSRCLVVWNKSDLTPDAAPGNGQEFSVSALTGDGIPLLMSAMVQHLIGEPPEPGAAVPFLPRHEELLRAALTAVLEQRYSVAEQHLVQLLTPT